MIIVSVLAMLCKSVIDFVSKLSASHSKGEKEKLSVKKVIGVFLAVASIVIIGS